MKAETRDDVFSSLHLLDGLRGSENTRCCRWDPELQRDGDSMPSSNTT